MNKRDSIAAILWVSLLVFFIFHVSLSSKLRLHFQQLNHSISTKTTAPGFCLTLTTKSSINLFVLFFPSILSSL